MSLKKIVPFYPNFTAEGEDTETHCVQAVVKMILAYYEPEQSFSWKELDKASGKNPNEATWEIDILLWLINRGYEVRRFTTFDYQAFIKHGKKYLADAYGQKAADWQEKYANLEKVANSAEKFIKKAIVIQKGFGIQDIKKFLDENWLIWIEVDSAVLNNQNEYSSHAVLSVGYAAQHIFIHDPGLPAHKYRKIHNNKLFEAAESNGYSMNAIRLKNSNK